MNDLISRQAAIDAMINSRSNADVTLVPGSYTNGWRDGRKLLLDELLQVVFELPSAQPTIDAEPVRRGYWEEVEVMPEVYDLAGVKTWASRLRCSNCGFATVAIEGRFTQYNYCPNCGAMNVELRKEE